MIAWLLVTPAILMGLLLLAAALETHVVAPDQRAELIRAALEVKGADEVEVEVARILRGIAPPRPAGHVQRDPAMPFHA